MIDATDQNKQTKLVGAVTEAYYMFSYYISVSTKLKNPALPVCTSP